MCCLLLLPWVFAAVYGLLSLCKVRASHCGGSFAVEHGLEAARLQWSQHKGSAAVGCGLSCPVVCGIFLDQGSNPRPLHWQVDS